MDEEEETEGEEEEVDGEKVEGGRRREIAEEAEKDEWMREVREKGGRWNRGGGGERGSGGGKEKRWRR